MPHESHAIQQHLNDHELCTVYRLAVPIFGGHAPRAKPEIAWEHTAQKTLTSTERHSGLVDATPQSEAPHTTNSSSFCMLVSCHRSQECARAFPGGLKLKLAALIIFIDLFWLYKIIQVLTVPYLDLDLPIHSVLQY